MTLLSRLHPQTLLQLLWGSKYINSRPPHVYSCLLKTREDVSSFFPSAIHVRWFPTGCLSQVLSTRTQLQLPVSVWLRRKGYWIWFIAADSVPPQVFCPPSLACMENTVLLCEFIWRHRHSPWIVWLGKRREMTHFCEKVGTKGCGMAIGTCKDCLTPFCSINNRARVPRGTSEGQGIEILTFLCF